MKSYNEEIFIENANKIWKGIYDYSLVKYINNKIPVKIICSEHGIFSKSPSKHINQNQGCPKCSIKKKSLGKKGFIKKANKIHNNKWDYSLVEYINNKTSIKIICKKHGIFEQKPRIHLNSSGCPKCSSNKLKDEKDVIKNFKEIWGDRWGYSLVNYKGSNKEIKIICPIHGVFKRKSENHKRNGCPECKGKYYNTNSFIKKANKIWKGFYDYSLVKYENSHKKIKIICPIHGIFEQLPYIHISKKECLKCSIEKRKLKEEDFILRSNKIWKDFYDYSLVDYLNSYTKVKIICPIHGVFKQTPTSHKKNRCPKCKSSKGEEKIRTILKGKKIKFEEQKTFKGCKNKLKLRFDFYIPKLNLAVEYNGKQHYEPIEWFGGKKRLNEIKRNDLIKKKYCIKNKINLLVITYKDNIKNKLLKNI